ncbi:RNI-like protein, partial [Saitoella complicata NRRL Y-17804]|uniref:RNI-like protein n=1 Tax=Saitoella complicata (strain BCRC 22490 / CBS 7301 / JCM 7358 / NBRC 10748 / NRRL Y-17804) TaxID=698492 RepID=UPI00086821B4
SGVRGPHSALTDFLRERGIRVQNLGRRNTNSASESPAPGTLLVAVAVGNPAPAPGPSIGGKRKRAPAKKKNKKRDDDSDFSDADNDAGGPSAPKDKATGPSKRSAFSHKKRLGPGMIDFCAQCNCRFTITAYTVSTTDETGLLCHTCGSAASTGDGKAADKAAAPKKVVKRKRAAKGKFFDEEKKIGTLQDRCIQLIAKHIHDIDMLGDIGSLNLDKICQIISRNRSLTPSTINLFLDAGVESVKLYDCSKLGVEEFRAVGAKCPFANELYLKWCGRITDDVVQYYADHLTQLTKTTFTGPFLVTVSAWRQFLSTTSTRLESFQLSDTSRWDAETMNTLVDACPNLISLRLSRITPLDDEIVRLATGLPNLTSLDLSWPGKAVSDAAIIDVLNTIGSGLLELNLDGHGMLTDAVLATIRECCGRLQKLSMSECETFTAEGITALFTQWDLNTGLTHLNLSRVLGMNDEALEAVIGHSVATLVSLDINSCDELTSAPLHTLASATASSDILEYIDVSFVRCVDDIVVEAL